MAKYIHFTMRAPRLSSYKMFWYAREPWSGGGSTLTCATRPLPGAVLLSLLEATSGVVHVTSLHPILSALRQRELFRYIFGRVADV